MKLKHVVIAVGMALGLTACGGGGGSSSSSYDFKVTAVDGYLKNAIVTATCGSATFTGTTNENGVAELDTNGYDSTDCSVVITANPDGTTIDMDTGEAYAAGELYLVSPAGQPKNENLIASPFTTMVALLVESSGGSMNLAAAIAEVAAQFDIAPSLVTGDFIAAKDSGSEDAQKAALKATALLSSPLWPKSAAEFEAMTADESADDALFTQLIKINTAVEAEIAELDNNGTDLSTVIITVTVADDGSVTTDVEDKPQATGATDSAVGGGTGS